MTVNKRLIQLREHLQLNQQKFAEKINRAQSTYCEYEKGKNIPERTILDICREFNVSEDWLRDGIGPMFRPAKDMDNELAIEFGKLIAGKDEFTKKLFLQYLKLPDEEKAIFQNFLENLSANTEKK